MPLLNTFRNYWRRYSLPGLLLHSYMTWNVFMFAQPDRNLSWWPPDLILKAPYFVAEVLTPEPLEPSHARFGPWLRTPTVFGLGNTLEKRRLRATLETIVDNDRSGAYTSGQVGLDPTTERLRKDLHEIPGPLRNRGSPEDLGRAGIAYALARLYRKYHCNHRTTDT